MRRTPLAAVLLSVVCSAARSAPLAGTAEVRRTPVPPFSSLALPPVQGHWAQEHYALPPGDDPAVARAVERYSGAEGLAVISGALERARMYRRFVADQIRLRGLPPELLWVPLVESSFRSAAVSRSGAAGIWQFMAASARHEGLAIDEWVDERLDFWRATHAALDKLQHNHRYFGDWLLALAAYNCGLGRLDRIIEASGVDDFWELMRLGLLPSETASYVPKLLAVMQIAGHPVRHGLAADWEPSPAWARVEIDRIVDLERLAVLSNIPADHLRAANTELRLGLLPPGRSHGLKVDTRYVGELQRVMADSALVLVDYHIHIVRSGDTLYGLARRYGLPLSAISRSNPAVIPERLVVGAPLRVPLPAGALAAATPTPVPAAELGGSYTVMPGDTLWGIARTFGTTPEALAAGNGRSLSLPIHAGDVLRVPQPGSPPDR